MLDGAVAVFDGVAGVEPQSETVWRQADRYGVPRICFVNKLDRTGAEFHRCVDMIMDRLRRDPARRCSSRSAPRPTSRGVVDLVAMKALDLAGEAAKGEMYDIVDIPADPRRGRARVARQADRDARRGRRRDHGAVPRGRRADRGRSSSPRSAARPSPAKLTPVLCGSAFKNKGVQPMLDAVVRYLPSPAGHRRRSRATSRATRTIVVERQPSNDEPFSALAFKIMSDPHLGKLTYIRIYSGMLETGTHGAEQHQGPQGADRQDLPDAREQA